MEKAYFTKRTRQKWRVQKKEGDNVIVSYDDPKERLLRLVSEMKKKGILIEFASHPCFMKRTRQKW